MIRPEIGKTYVTNGGYNARILGKISNSYPFIGSINIINGEEKEVLMSWTKYGTALSLRSGDPYNLLKEYIPPVKVEFWVVARHYFMDKANNITFEIRKCKPNEEALEEQPIIRPNKYKFQILGPFEVEFKDGE